MSCEKSISRKKTGTFCWEKFHLLYYPAMRWCYNILLSNFRSITYLVVTHWRSKTKENFELLALREVAVAYERWSLTGGSKFSDLTFGILENWSLRRGGRLREVVATGGSTVYYMLLCHSWSTGKPTTGDHIYNLRVKSITLGNHALNDNFISGRCGVDDG